jgi:hypothetical protein
MTSGTERLKEAGVAGTPTHARWKLGSDRAREDRLLVLPEPATLQELTDWLEARVRRYLKDPAARRTEAALAAFDDMRAAWRLCPALERLWDDFPAPVRTQLPPRPHASHNSELSEVHRVQWEARERLALAHLAAVARSAADAVPGRAR